MKHRSVNGKIMPWLVVKETAGKIESQTVVTGEKGDSALNRQDSEGSMENHRRT